VTCKASSDSSTGINLFDAGLSPGNVSDEDWPDASEFGSLKVGANVPPIC
jgi:hypothetical protein